MIQFTPPFPTFDHLTAALDYVRWGDETQTAACAAINPDAYLSKDHGFSFRTLHDTLLHMMGAQEIWLSRFSGHPLSARPSRNEFPSLLSIQAHWPKLHHRYAAFLAAKPDLSKVISWTTFDGKPASLELGHLLLHVLDHATLHRGQLNSMLKLSGATPPAVMYYTYILARRSN